MASSCDSWFLYPLFEDLRRLMFDPENSRRMARIVPRRALFQLFACLLLEVLGDHGSNLMSLLCCCGDAAQ